MFLSLNAVNGIIPIMKKYLNMNIIESYKTCFIKKYADFKGKASRSEYWWFWLIYLLILLGLPLIGLIFDNPYSSGGILYKVGLIALISAWLIGSLGMLCPFVAVSIRRLRDAGYSGWWFLIRFIPYIGSIITWVLMSRKSK